MFSNWYVLAIASAELYKLVSNELFCVMEQSTFCINGVGHLWSKRVQSPALAKLYQVRITLDKDQNSKLGDFFSTFSVTTGVRQFWTVCV